MHRSRLAIVSLAAAGLLAAACGSDSTSSGTTVTAPGSSSAASGGGSTPDSAAATIPAASTSVDATQVIGSTTTPARGSTADTVASIPPDDTSTDSTEVSSTVGKGSDPTSPYCVALQAYFDANDKLGGALGDESDPAVIKPLADDLESKMTAFEQAASTSPVAADVNAVSKPRHEFLDVFAELNYDLQAVQDDPRAQAYRTVFNSAETTAAVERIVQANTAVCGIDTEF